MKFVFTPPKKEFTAIEFSFNTLNKYIEHKDGTTTLLVGVGEKEKMNNRSFHIAIRKSVRYAREQKIERISFDLHNYPFSFVSKTKEELGRTIAENCVMANYEFTQYKKKETYQGVEELYIKNAAREHKEGIARGHVVADASNVARDLSNTSAGDMTPTTLANAAKKIANDPTIKVKILSKKEIETLKMGLLLGVDRASVEPCKFIIMEYWGGKKTEKPTVLIGKGVTFDTGGLNLKPTSGILNMHHDMSGGAAVIAAISVAAKLKLKKNVVALIPAVENAISGSAIRPGDVLTAMNGVTVEVLNTDAEGRLILGDALTYAERYKPEMVIDIATLTGAATVALGSKASVVMTRQQDLEDTLKELGEKAGDYVWSLPLWEEYEADLKSDRADIVNTSTPATEKEAGAIMGGIFIGRFAKKFSKWVHIDIAARDETTLADNLAPGASGVSVRFLVRILEEI